LYDAIGYDAIGYDAIGYDAIGYDAIGYDAIGYEQEKNGSYFKSKFNPTIHPSNLKFNYLRKKM